MTLSPPIPLGCGRKSMMENLVWLPWKFGHPERRVRGDFCRPAALVSKVLAALRAVPDSRARQVTEKPGWRMLLHRSQCKAAFHLVPRRSMRGLGHESERRPRESGTARRAIPTLFWNAADAAGI